MPGLFFSPLTGKARNSSGRNGFSEELLPYVQVNIWGVEAWASTYGLGVSVPFLWIQDRVKFVPLAGFFWDDVADGEFSTSEFAYGGKILYYFPSKSESAGKPTASI